jgi:hypothetical protein
MNQWEGEMKSKQELIEAIKEAEHEARITFEEAQANHRRRLAEIETMQSELDAMEEEPHGEDESA